MSIDWQHEIDTAVEHLPDRATSDYVAAGHCAVRRRRIAGGAAALTVVVAMAGVGWTLSPAGPVASTDAPIASDPSAVGAAPAATLPWVPGGAPARVVPGRGLEIRDGAVVHDRRDDLFPGKDTDSVALDLSFNGRRSWVLLEWDDGGSSSARSTPDGRIGGFEAFIEEHTANGGMVTPEVDPFDEEYPFDGLVRYVPGEPLAVRDGVQIVRQVDNPRGVEAPARSVGLVVEYGGETTWMSLENRPPGSGAGTTEGATESGWPTFDLWLAADVALQKQEPGLVLARLGADGTMTPGEDGVEIIDQQADPDVPQFADESATTSGVAMLRWQGMTWFVLAARYDDEQATGTFEAGKAGGAENIEAFLDFARDRYDEGGAQ